MRAQHLAEVDDVVLEVAALALGHVHVERVLRVEVGVVEPRAEDPQRADRTPMLVRDGVVGVVAPDPALLEAALGLAGEEPARQHAVLAVFGRRPEGEQALEIGGRDRVLFFEGVFVHRVLADPDVVETDMRDVFGRHVVPERPEEARRNGGGRSLELGGHLGVELEQIALTGRVLDHEAGVRPVGLALHHRDGEDG